MITYTEIVKAINNKIKTQFPKIKFNSNDTDVGVEAGDVKTKLIRPSFRVSLDGIKSSNFMNLAKDRKMTVRIYYFPSKKDKYRIEMLDIQDKLETVFVEDNIIITENGNKIEIYETEFDTIDGVLHFYFKIQLYEDLNKLDDGENMEEINI